MSGTVYKIAASARWTEKSKHHDNGGVGRVRKTEYVFLCTLSMLFQMQRDMYLNLSAFFMEYFDPVYFLGDWENLEAGESRKFTKQRSPTSSMLRKVSLRCHSEHLFDFLQEIFDLIRIPSPILYLDEEFHN